MKLTETLEFTPAGDIVLCSFPHAFPSCADANSNKIIALLEARTFQYKIQAPLVLAGIWPDEPPFLKDILAKAKAAFDTSDTVEAVLNSTLREPDKLLAAMQFRVLGRVSEGLFSEPLYMLPAFNRLYGYFAVSDIQRGLVIVKSVLAEEGVLDGARIGYYDSAARCCYTFYPENTNERFDDHAAIIIKAFASFRL